MKKAKAEVEYSKGHADSHCGPLSGTDTHYCVNFIRCAGYTGQSCDCKKVIGRVDPTYWCKLYRRVSS
jgi:hypothetical protein